MFGGPLGSGSADKKPLIPGEYRGGLFAALDQVPQKYNYGEIVSRFKTNYSVLVGQE
jgi:hypothetical protein